MKRLGQGVVLLLCIGSAGFAADTPSARRSGADMHISGQSRTVYQYRSSDEDTDEDLYQYIFVRGRSLVDHQLDLYLSGRFHSDLDSTGDSLADDIFTSVEDTRDADELHVYQLYVDTHTQGRLVRMRTGRQYIDVADRLHLDGIQFKFTEDRRFGGRVFFGLPVSYYSDVDHDNAAGASLVGRPWKGNQARFTYALYSDNSEDDRDFHYALDIKQRYTDAFRMRARASALDDDFHRAGVDAFYFPGDADFDCVAGIHRWGGLADKTRAYSPLTRVLGRRDPYTYAYVRVYNRVLPWLWVSPGAAFRQLVHSSDSDSFNREYANYDLTFTFEPCERWSISIAGEQWDVNGGDSFFDVSGEVEYKHGKVWEVSVGADYVAYDYEQFSDFSYSGDAGDIRVSSDGTTVEESPDAYTYYLRAKWNIARLLSLRIRGEIEDNSVEEDDSYGVRTSVVLKF